MESPINEDTRSRQQYGLRNAASLELGYEVQFRNEMEKKKKIGITRAFKFHPCDDDRMTQQQHEQSNANTRVED